MKKLIILLIFITSMAKQAQAQCNNTGFENGNFSGWVGNIGYNANSNNPLTSTSATISTLGINAAETGCSFHTLVTAAAGNDPWGGFPMLDPNGGNYAVRLGGENINTNNEAQTAGCVVNFPSGVPDYYSNGESLQQTFAVTPGNVLLTYKYAVVLEAAPHPNGQQPYFRIELLNQTGASILCYSYTAEGDSAGNFPPGFINAAGAYYLPWQTSSFDLRPYIGQNVTLLVTAAGCIPGGHFGYGYIDCVCSPAVAINVSAPLCTGGIATLTAPPVVQGTYTWTGPGIVSGANSQIATVNIGGSYSVTVAYPSGCSYSLDTTIVFSSSTAPTVNIVSDSSSICIGSTATLTASGAHSYTWNTSDTTAVISVTPTVTTSYTVVGTGTNSCTNTATITEVVTNCNTTGIKQLLVNHNQVTLYPNPASNSVQVSLSGNIENTTLQIIDALGNTVKQSVIYNPQAVINLSDLAEGVYTISISNNTGITNKRLVIVR